MISYDENGMLVLPEDVQIEFMQIKKFAGRHSHLKTGVYVTCICGYKWERGSMKAGTIRCHKCSRKMKVKEIEVNKYV